MSANSSEDFSSPYGDLPVQTLLEMRDRFARVLEIHKRHQFIAMLAVAFVVFVLSAVFFFGIGTASLSKPVRYLSQLSTPIGLLAVAIIAFFGRRTSRRYAEEIGKLDQVLRDRGAQ